MSAVQPAEMGTPLFVELKKQASSYFKEKIRLARLALTDVTPAELLAEEATDEGSHGPDSRTMKLLSRAAFEVDDYWRIVDVMHRKLQRTDRRYWRESYKALILLDYLLTHGPLSIAEEFQPDKAAIQKLGLFGFVDEKGFNWGLAARRKSERVLRLLEKGPLLAEERERATKLAIGIKGFGREGADKHEEVLPDARRFLGKASSLYHEHCEVEDRHSLLLESEAEAEAVAVAEEKSRAVDLQQQQAGEGEIQPARMGSVQLECAIEESRPLLCC